MKYFLGKKYAGKIELSYDNLVLSNTKPLITEEICWGMFDMKEIDKFINNDITMYLENENNDVIGFINFNVQKKKKTIEVHRLCSMKQYKGNGKKLLLTLIEIAKQMGIEYISLIPAPTKKVIDFYKEIGFSPVGIGITYVYNVEEAKLGGKTKKKLQKNIKNKKTKNTINI
jgi:GNAT superfamily N-acetyltransferase